MLNVPRLFQILIVTFFLIVTSVAASAAEPNNLTPPPTDIPNLIETQNKQLSRIGDQLQTIVSAPHDDLDKAQIEKEDLRAQKKMAKWAKAMFWISFISLGGTVFSVWLLYKSLKQNTNSIQLASKSLQLSEKTSEIQFRAYLGIRIEDSYLQLLDAFPYPFVEIVFKNHGATPARNIGISAGSVFKDFDKGDNYEYVHGMPDPSLSLILMPGCEIKITHYFREQLMPYVQQVNNRQSKLHVNAQVKYEDVFNKQHITTFRFVIHYSEHSEVTGAISEYGNMAT